MITQVIMPALGMAQETGKLIHWLVQPGAAVNKGDPLMEVETDKATVEIEAPGSGTLMDVTARAGDEVPVGHVIAVIVPPGELHTGVPPTPGESLAAPQTPPSLPAAANPSASPLAVRVAAEHGVNLRLVNAKGGRVEKADVLAYLESHKQTAPPGGGRILASPKARRLAEEQGLSLAAIQGTGPEGAVQVADIQAAGSAAESAQALTSRPPTAPPAADAEPVSTIWRVMAERMTQSWTTVPHFYLVREVNAERLVAWRAELLKRSAEKVTFTDLIVRIAAAGLVQHPRITSSWKDGGIAPGSGVHVGIAMAVEAGLVVPVIHDADRLSVVELAVRRQELAGRVEAGKLRLEDLQGGNFTVSNLGMYGVDGFNAIVNPPQAAILAVGRIADRVVALNGQPAVKPTMILTLSCDHRAVDGARGAAFLDTLSSLIEEPLAILR